MGRIVCKFGGSSVAGAGQFKKIRKILEANPNRRIVVPSAPGKANPQETKITDLLYTCHRLVKLGQSFEEPFDTIRQKFIDIEKELGLQNGVEESLEEVKAAIQQFASRDYVASRGEYLCGELMALYLGAEFVDPKDYVFLSHEGRIDPKTYVKLSARLSDSSVLYVMPGYFGSDPNGEIKTFSRGGSDISGAIAARAVNAELYENWTDVSGLLMTDPGVVDNPKPIKQISYREIRELAYMGAQVFHDQAIEPVRDVGIPILIKNTNRPDDEGTLILKEVKNKSPIAGIAGKKDAVVFNIEKNMMNREKGFGRRVLEVFERFDVSYEHSPTGIDSMNVVVVKEELQNHGESILEEIHRILQPNNVTLLDDLALIATVGEGMQQSIGTAARLFCSLRDAGVNVRIIDQGSSELNIIVGVNRCDYEKAVQALYSEFIKS